MTRKDHFVTHPKLIIHSAIELSLILTSVLFMQGGCVETKPKKIPCLERAVFGDPAQSPYVLPYPVGKSYRLIQGYCYPKGGHRDQLAYDFGMPIGDDVVAARAGTSRPAANPAIPAGSRTCTSASIRHGWQSRVLMCRSTSKMPEGCSQNAAA